MYCTRKPNQTQQNKMIQSKARTSVVGTSEPTYIYLFIGTFISDRLWFHKKNRKRENAPKFNISCQLLRLGFVKSVGKSALEFDHLADFVLIGNKSIFCFHPCSIRWGHFLNLILLIFLLSNSQKRPTLITGGKITSWREIFNRL